MSDDIAARLLRIDRVGVPSILTEAAEEIERLRAERDEARRIICYDESYNHKSGVTPREVAEDRGWDCFKEDNNG